MSDPFNFNSQAILLLSCLMISLVLTQCIDLWRKSLRAHEKAKLKKEEDERFEVYFSTIKHLSIIQDSRKMWDGKNRRGEPVRDVGTLEILPDGSFEYRDFSGMVVDIEPLSISKETISKCVPINETPEDLFKRLKVSEIDKNKTWYKTPTKKDE